MHCDEASKKEILKAVKKSGNNNYDAAIFARPTPAGLYHLAGIRGNLVEWLAPPQGAGILEIGAEAGGLTSPLLKASGKVTAVEQDRLYADILSARFRTERDFKLLNMDVGRALTVLADAQMYFSLIVVNLDSAMFSAYNLEMVKGLIEACYDLLDARGVLLFLPSSERKTLLHKDAFKNATFYAAYPSCAFPEIIRSAREYKNAGGEQFALLSKTRQNYPISIHYNTQRRDCFAIRTDVVKDSLMPGGLKIVHHPMTSEAKNHIANMYRAYLLLSERYCRDDGMMVPDCRKDEDILIRPLIHSKSLTTLLDERLSENDYEGFRDLFDRFCEELRYGRKMAISILNLRFSSVRISDDGTWFLDDCEFCVEESIPPEEMLFPAIYEYESAGVPLREQVDFAGLYTAIGVHAEDMDRYIRKYREFATSISGSKYSIAELLETVKNVRESASEVTVPIVETQNVKPENSVSSAIQKSEDYVLTAPRLLYQELHCRSMLLSYKRELHKKCNAYEAFLAEHRKERPPYDGMLLPNVEVIRMDHLCGNFTPGRRGAPYVVFVSGNGKMTEDAKKEIAYYFETHPKAMLVYADEDHVNGTGGFYAPIFKPEWSPHTLSAFNYIGNIWAVRRSLLPDYYWFESTSYRVNAYEYLLYLLGPFTGISPDARKEGEVGHIPKVLFHIREEEEFLLGSGRQYDAMRLRISRLQSRPAVIHEADGFSHLRYETTLEPTISIIIPSKDNPEMLEKCLASIREYTEYEDLEILVTDNGSSARNKARIEKLAVKYDFRYHYEPAEFNFAAICNKAALLATGEYLLFMNDDTRVTTKGWLKSMLGEAMLPEVGAVSVRMRYPDMHRLQHVGIGNFSGFSGNLLCGRDDGPVYYMGNNRLTYDVLAVSAACMLIAAGKFKEVGAFDERLACSQNDVELCFRLFKAGYYNVVRNDVVLIHHESYSRGSDLRDDAKRKRHEADLLYVYEKHPDMIGYDPFRSPNLCDSGDSFSCRYPYNYEECSHIKAADLSNADGNQEGLVVTVEEAMTCVGSEKVRITGWQFVPGMDNACFRFSLCLKGRNTNYEIPVVRVLRRDVAALLRGQQHIGLSGFDCRFDRRLLESGEYEIWGHAVGGSRACEFYRNSGIKLLI